ncbi:hypothetical protein OV208_25340 [Corallococcus sp. bb12-1]|uniref:hypothetical protein n=1 Tax=Corallococcus sp. bb12-1 TaxID=2996784 RepID=UPI002271AC13|nr:hypothetical protein [Corallococcus sp. bb12-1]MCY1044667.1 hypothetical protein [Corallococcus sp. bb12-1]
MKTSTVYGAALRALAFAGLALMLRGGEAQAQNFTEEHILLLIDRSGSMQAVRPSTGRTRFTDAITRARTYSLLPSALPRSYAVWTFEGTTYVKAQGFSSAKVTIATLAKLAVGNGVTPLAYAVCDSVDELLQHQPGVEARKVVHLVSDGEENSTPPGSLCYGPSSTTAYPNLAVDSWQWKVRNMLKTGDPLRDSAAPFRLVFDVDVFANQLTFAGTTDPVAEDTGTERPEESMSATLPPAYLAFLSGVSAASGGTYMPISDTSPMPVYGDTNQDYCVDGTDYNLVLANYGHRVPPANPAADVNGDRVVDYADYSIVVNNQGTGCRTKPLTFEQ